MSKKKEVIAKQKNKPYNFDVEWEAIMEFPDFIEVMVSDVLEDYIIKQRWYGGKSSKLKYIELVEYFRLQNEEEVYYGLLLEVNFEEAFYQHYFLPIAFVSDQSFAKDNRILSISIKKQEGYIIDATHLEAFRRVVFNRIRTAEPNDNTRVQYHKSEKFLESKYQSSRLMGIEQSNTSIIYNNAYVLKFFRRIYVDRNPDYEMSRFLSEKKDFKNTPAYLGSIQIKDQKNVNITIGLMQQLVANDGDAWEYMLTELHKVFSNIEYKNIKVGDLPKASPFERLNITETPPQIIDWVGLNLLMKIQKLASRTAEMHIALGSEFEDTAFTPQRFNGDYEVWLKNRLLYQFQNRLNAVENNLHKLDGLALDLAKELLEKKNVIRERFVDFNWTELKGERLRVHGDYHLGQILVTGDDFFILDFEGEPESTIRDRKVKQPPLKDVAGLFRSFHYAIYANIFTNADKYKDDQETLFQFGEILYEYFINLFLGTYVVDIKKANINIGYRNERIFLLKYSLLEKAVYELGYELNSRPRWAVIPLKGIINIIH